MVNLQSRAGLSLFLRWRTELAPKSVNKTTRTLIPLGRGRWSTTDRKARMIEHPVPAEKSGRVDHFKWLTDNSQILIAECQAEGRNLIENLILNLR